jgi:hypothetical protein
MQLLSSSSLKPIKRAVSLTEEVLIWFMRAAASQIMGHVLSRLSVVPLLISKVRDRRLEETSLVELRVLLSFYSRYSESCFEH